MEHNAETQKRWCSSVLLVRVVGTVSRATAGPRRWRWWYCGRPSSEERGGVQGARGCRHILISPHAILGGVYLT